MECLVLFQAFEALQKHLNLSPQQQPFTKRLTFGQYNLEALVMKSDRSWG